MELRRFLRIFSTNLLAIAIFLLLLSPNQSEGRVIFSEDFESGSLEGNWVLYFEFGDPVTSGFETRPEYVHSGKSSFRLTACERAGEESGSNIRYFFLPGEEKCHSRWYGMFAEDFDQGNLMHYIIIGGSRIDNQWSAYDSTAGRKPDGTDFFVTLLDPWRDWGKHPAPGAMQFYSYFVDMKKSRDGHYWGNSFKPETPFLIERGRWYCFEVMVLLNGPGQSNGEQAFWIDGEKIVHQKGIRWRDTRMLKLNSLVLDVYIHNAVQDNTAWFDDVIISTEYIGPVR